MGFSEVDLEIYGLFQMMPEKQSISVPQRISWYRLEEPETT